MPARPKTQAAKPPLSRGKLWLFRLVALVGAPLVFVLLLEVLLRLAGFGYSTAFLLPDKIGERQVWVPNPQFSWRFFGREQARQPLAFALSRPKPADTVRIFVFGESAAFGDPQPDFGLARMLETLLRLRFPETRFEVVNVAMTGINSHTVRAIARDCARAEGDIWVVYMGNNEVVGPFGAGTVFGAQAPPLGLIRAQLVLKTTRTGQLLDELARRIHPPPADKREWGGMLMFVENQVRHDDARLPAVYRAFEGNLRDIIAAGRRSGAGVVVSTVAVNLRDCPPFTSVLNPRLSEADRNRFAELAQRGTIAQQAGNHAAAVALFREAERLGPDMAALHFRLGQCALASGDRTAAEKCFRRARDLDALRFRCDSRLNEITRRVAGERVAAAVALADAEMEFAKQSAGLPGAELFYEHVHLTLAGNYLLARTIGEQVLPLLPEAVRSRGGATWAAPPDCARRLAWSARDEHAGLMEILGRLNDPPFTFQLDHPEQVRRLRRQAEALLPGLQPPALRETEGLVRAALQLAPDDAALLARLAALQQINGDLTGALAAARRVVELLPNHPGAWEQLGAVQARLDLKDEAAQSFRESWRRDPQNVFALNSLAQVLQQLGRKEEALREYERAVQVKPRYGTAYLGLGRLLEEMGRAEEAEVNFRKALTNRVNRSGDLAALARFCHAKGWLAEATTNYAQALALNPADAPLHLNAGQCCAQLQRPEEARLHFAEAVRLAPALVEARFLLGRELGRGGDNAGAAEQFAQVVALAPELVEGRINLGVALMNLGRTAEALREFEEVLRRDPQNAAARKNLELLRQR